MNINGRVPTINIITGGKTMLSLCMCKHLNKALACMHICVAFVISYKSQSKKPFNRMGYLAKLTSNVIGPNGSYGRMNHLEKKPYGRMIQFAEKPFSLVPVLGIQISCTFFWDFMGRV